MTLTPGVPDWVVGLASIAGDLQERLMTTGRVGGVHVRPAIPASGFLTVTVARYTGSQGGAGWHVASGVAGLWPGWLDAAGVGLEVAGVGWRFVAGCDVMVRVAAGEMRRAEWILASRNI